MGLDSVELVLAVEDSFQIHIEDEEASEISTVGDLFRLVVSKTQPADSKRCLTSTAFYRTRRALMATLGVPRKQISPSTSLEILVPLESRRAHWKRLAEAIGLKLPSLQLPRSMQLELLALGVVSFMLLAVGFGVGLQWVLALFLPGLLVGGLFIRLAAPLATSFPFAEQTVGALAREVLVLNVGQLAKEAGGWNEAEIWESLRSLIVNQVGVEKEQITPEARLADDLGID